MTALLLGLSVFPFPLAGCFAGDGEDCRERRSETSELDFVQGVRCIFGGCWITSSARNAGYRKTTL